MNSASVLRSFRHALSMSMVCRSIPHAAIRSGPPFVPVDAEFAMLRQKLLFNLGPIILLLGCGVGSIVMLQHVLAGIHEAQTPEQMQAVAGEFRWVILLVAIAFVVILNVSVLMVAEHLHTIERRRMEILQ